MTTKLTSPSQIPDLLKQLQQSGFFGEVNIQFRAGEVCRVVTSQSTIFPTEKNSNDRFSR